MAGARTSRLSKYYVLCSKQYFQTRTFSSNFHETTSSTRSRLTSRRILTGSLLGSLIAAGAYVGTSDEATISTWSFQASKYLNPLFRLLDPEDAHKLAIFAASHGLAPRESRPDPSILHVKVWGRDFSNPIGLAAGFDKDAEAMEGLLGIGFGFVEVGSITPLPQEGNPKPRVFRLPEQGAIINRYGFNSQGIMAVAKRLGALHGKKRLAESVQATPAATSSPLSPFGQGNQNKVSVKSSSGLLGVNLGKNKATEDAASDYVKGVHTLSTYADYLVINVSSPNTPGLRKLQGRKQLKNLIKKVIEARDEMQWGERGPPPLLVKIAPDLSKQDLADIAAVALTLQLDGLIISNTTTSRPDSVVGIPHAEEIGGLSGKPLFELSTQVLQQMYRLTKGKVTLIGCGGVNSGEDAYMKIRSGATLVQLYTALVYEGPAVIPRIKKELAACLERDGFKSIQDAVGVDCR